MAVRLSPISDAKVIDRQLPRLSSASGTGRIGKLRSPALSMSLAASATSILPSAQAATVEKMRNHFGMMPKDYPAGLPSSLADPLERPDVACSFTELQALAAAPTESRGGLHGTSRARLRIVFDW